MYLIAVHRLDRLTSGLLIFAKTIAKAQQLDEEIRERKVTKVYVCRVKGEFPRYHQFRLHDYDVIMSYLSVSPLSAMSLFWWSPTSWGCVVSTRPVKNAPPTSHASLSTEDRASFNVDHLTYPPLHHVPSTSFSSSSGVPKTGRMHQIRVHLQWLGRLWPRIRRALQPG